MFNPDRPVILPDDTPIVTGPAPAQRPDPKGHQTLIRSNPPSTSKHQTEPPRRATDSPQAAARASLPYPTMSINNVAPKAPPAARDAGGVCRPPRLGSPRTAKPAGERLT
jgi:hypothetical protein